MKYLITESQYSLMDFKKIGHKIKNFFDDRPFEEKHFEKIQRETQKLVNFALKLFNTKFNLGEFKLITSLTPNIGRKYTDESSELIVRCQYSLNPEYDEIGKGHIVTAQDAAKELEKIYEFAKKIGLTIINVDGIKYHLNFEVIN